MKRFAFAVVLVVLLFATAILMMSFPSREIGESRPVACMNTARPKSLTVTPQEGMLTVTPSDGSDWSGLVGGPFNPTLPAVYNLQNTGGAPINWTAAKTQPWLMLSAAGGTLAAGASVAVGITINGGSLAPGRYYDQVTFTNTTNGSGNTTRSVALNVAPPGMLTVTPSGGLTSTGKKGGPFSPASIVYTVRNSGQWWIKWKVEKTQPWITISGISSGDLHMGDSPVEPVTISINSNANSLAPKKTYTDTLTFWLQDGIGGWAWKISTTRLVSLTVR